MPSIYLYYRRENKRRDAALEQNTLDSIAGHEFDDLTDRLVMIVPKIADFLDRTRLTGTGFDIWRAQVAVDSDPKRVHSS